MQLSKSYFSATNYNNNSSLALSSGDSQQPLLLSKVLNNTQISSQSYLNFLNSNTAEKIKGKLELSIVLEKCESATTNTQRENITNEYDDKRKTPESVQKGLKVKKLMNEDLENMNPLLLDQDQTPTALSCLTATHSAMLKTFDLEPTKHLEQVQQQQQPNSTETMPVVSNQENESLVKIVHNSTQQDYQESSTLENDKVDKESGCFDFSTMQTIFKDRLNALDVQRVSIKSQLAERYQTSTTANDAQIKKEKLHTIITNIHDEYRTHTKYIKKFTNKSKSSIKVKRPTSTLNKSQNFAPAVQCSTPQSLLNKTFQSIKVEKVKSKNQAATDKHQQKNKNSLSRDSLSFSQCRSVSKLSNSRTSLGFFSNQKSQTKIAQNEHSMNESTYTSTNSQHFVKSQMISKGLREKSEIINQKNLSMNCKIEEKKELVNRINQYKKDLVQTRKQVKLQIFTNQEIQEDVDQLSSVLDRKTTSTAQIRRDTCHLLKEVKTLTKECEDVRDSRQELLNAIEKESQLRGEVETKVMQLKKLINEAKKEKERIQVQIKSEQKKVIENLQKRKEILNEDSSKLFSDFQQTMKT